MLGKVSGRHRTVHMLDARQDVLVQCGIAFVVFLFVPFAHTPKTLISRTRTQRLVLFIV